MESSNMVYEYLSTFPQLFHPSNGRLEQVFIAPMPKLDVGNRNIFLRRHRTSLVPFPKLAIRLLTADHWSTVYDRCTGPVRCQVSGATPVMTGALWTAPTRLQPL